MDRKPRRWRVIVLDTKKNNPNHYICIAIVRALSASPLVDFVIRSDYQTVVRDATLNKCDLLIAFDGEQLDRTFLEKINNICERNVMWVTEDPYERAVNAANADLFDLVFTNDAGSVAAYGAKGRHLPFAADRLFHFHSVPLSDEDHYFYDLFFAGTAWPNRANFINTLKRAIPEINLKLALPTNPHIPAPNIAGERSAYDWRTPNTEFAKFANRSRSVLTLHREYSSSGNDPVAKTPGPRFFEVALAGGFQLVDASIKEIEVDNFYEEGRDFAAFRSVDECVAKLSYYLTNKSERLAMARSAQQATLDRHLYVQRVDYLLDQVQQLQLEISDAGTAVDLSVGIRRRILIVSHNISGVKPYGGVEVYQESIRLGLRDKYEFFFYTPDRSTSGNYRYILRDEDLKVIEEFQFADNLDDKLLTCANRERIFSEILRNYAIDAVHFQHLIGHSPSIALLPRTLGLGTVLSLHDYYGICSRFNLLDYRGVFCQIDKRPPETCDICLNAAEGIAPGSQARRHAFFSRLLQSIDILHANTDGVAAMYQNLYPTLNKTKNLRVGGVPMPKAAFPLVGPSHDAVPTLGNRLRVAIPGNIAPNKGGDTIIHALNLLRGQDIEFTIFGTLAPHYVEILKVLDFKNLIIYGEFSPGELPALLRGFSVSLHLSNWPETYCISLSEAWAAGVVPIVSDIGALGERVFDGVNGYTLPPNEPGSLVALLRRILADRDLIERIKPELMGHSSVTHDGHMSWLAAIYDEIIPTQTADRNPTRLTGSAVREIGIRLVHDRWVSETAAPALPSSTIIGAFPLQRQTFITRIRRVYVHMRMFGTIPTATIILRKIIIRFRSWRSSN